MEAVEEKQGDTLAAADWLGFVRWAGSQEAR
jgi:hypothetical protein